MKIALIGGGGFRAPITWEAIAAVAEENDVELFLHDTSEMRLARVGAVIEGLRHERGGPPARPTTDLVTAIEDADVIMCAIRVGGLEGRIADESVPLSEGVLGQETIGPGGISFALRTLPVMLDIARAAKEHAPNAWFLNFTNPAGLITEALRPILGDRVVGICDSPAALCARVAASLGRPMAELDFDYAGLNHLGWLLAVRENGNDLLPELLGDDARMSTLEETRLFGIDGLRDQGMIPNEYLVYYESPDEIVDAFRRAGATRARIILDQENRFYRAPLDGPEDALATWRSAKDARFGSYMAEVWDAVGVDGTGGATAGEDPEEGGYAAIAAGFIHAVTHDSGEVLVLNVANRGLLSGLDAEAVVEVPCCVRADGPHPCKVGELPREQSDLVALVKEVERLTIRAAATGNRSLALRALATHPVVPSAEAAEEILSHYLSFFPEIAAHLR